MNIVKTSIEDLLIVEPQVFGDERGYFLETYNEKKFLDLGLATNFVQDNHSFSTQGILRGLHFQTSNTQGKLVRVIHGEVYDVAVDLRKESETYGQSIGVNLSGENKKMFWVPKGFAHGFYVISETAHFVYKCTDFYSPKHEVTIRWDDPDLDIKWPIVARKKLNLSSKDMEGIEFCKAGYFFSGNYFSSD